MTWLYVLLAIAVLSAIAGIGLILLIDWADRHWRTWWRK